MQYRLLQPIIKHYCLNRERLLLLCPWEWLRSILMSMSVCLSVHKDISRTTRAIFTNFFCACCLCLWLSMSTSGTVTIGCITYHQEGVFFPSDNAQTTCGKPHTNFLCMLLVSVARSSSDMFTIGHIGDTASPIAGKGFSSLLKMIFRPGKGDGSAQCGGSTLSTIALF